MYIHVEMWGINVQLYMKRNECEWIHTYGEDYGNIEILKTL